jgi:hypothetical protein
MRRVAVAVLVFITTGIGFGHQGPGEWIKYSSPEGRYSILLPTEPKLSTQETTASTGEKVPQYLASSPDGNGVVVIGYFDYTTEMTFSFDKARSGMVTAMNATLLDEDSISLGGSPGRAFKLLAKPADQQEFLVRARLYDVGRRVYVLQCIFPKAEDSPTVVEKCGKFVDSFKVEARP